MWGYRCLLVHIVLCTEQVCDGGGALPRYRATHRCSFAHGTTLQPQIVLLLLLLLLSLLLPRGSVPREPEYQ